MSLSVILELPEGFLDLRCLLILPTDSFLCNRAVTTPHCDCWAPTYQYPEFYGESLLHYRKQNSAKSLFPTKEEVVWGQQSPLVARAASMP